MSGVLDEMTHALSNIVEKARIAVDSSLAEFRCANASEGRVYSEEGRDIKLEADLFLHKELVERLTRSTGIGCLSEEDKAGHRWGEMDPVWIIDPLDGSMNYSRRVPLYCISVALWRGGRPEIGLVYDIERSVEFWSFNGRTLSNNASVAVGKVAQLDRAILATGFPLQCDISQNAVNWFLNFAASFKKVRMLGTAALSLAWTAEGRLDAYFEKDIMLWDVAAGLALVQGAGGVYMMRPGRKPMSYDVLAANPVLASAMQKMLHW